MFYKSVSACQVETYCWVIAQGNNTWWNIYNFTFQTATNRDATFLWVQYILCLSQDHLSLTYKHKKHILQVDYISLTEFCRSINYG